MKNYTPIPQNPRLNFHLTWDTSWKHTLDVKFDIDDSIDIVNLYLIFTYYLQDGFFVKIIYTIGDPREGDLSQTKIFYKISYKMLKRMNFREFESWFDETLFEDWKYISISRNYGFRFIFFKESVNIPEKIYPIYPWTDSFKNMRIHKDHENEQKIKFLEEKISQLAIRNKKPLPHKTIPQRILYRWFWIHNGWFGTTLQNLYKQFKLIFKKKK